MQNKNFFITTVGIIVTVLLVLCCCCFIVIAGGLGGAYYIKMQVTPIPEKTPFGFSLDGSDSTATPAPAPAPTPIEIARIPVESIPTDTLQTLEDTIVPVNNPLDLACRLQGKCAIPETYPSGPFKAGDKQSFYLSNTDSADHFQVETTLKYVTDHAYFWVENGISYNQDEAKQLVDTFETKMYPTDREFFGSEWTPGVDGDQHIYLVYARGIGGSVAGYFSSPDEYHPDAFESSNAHEMFVFNADNSPLSDTYTYGVLAHEFQHMIHWKQDRNETSWLNEGFSEVAVLLNGYYVGSADSEYIANTDVQLTDWGPDPGTNGPHYGSSFLFLTYFLDRFGKEATQALVKDQQNGMDSVDNILKSINATDKLTNQPITADDVFMDWAATNYLLDGSVSDGRFIYHNYENASQASETETVSDCPNELTSTVKQYGVDYIHFACGGIYTLHFEGATQTGLLPVDAFSGKKAFWSNKGDESDMTLTRNFDFSAVSGPLTLKFQTWYDLENDYDYTFLEASPDGGKTWQIIKTPSGTDTDPSGNSYGWGYNGQTDGWMEESVDLSQFAGQKVQIRFEYVTDAAVNGGGFMLDDISIPEIGYSSDFEADNGGWESTGFVRVENILPQTFRLALINNNGETTVQSISVGADQTADINIDLSDATLIVSGTTRFTREDGHYTITVK
ncbi:MAG: immune inhibitor A [Chloroflexi bacterium]|nr:immune inhibitor A [Chloroflexota bacterium]